MGAQSTSCSCRSCGFGSLHPHGSSQPPVCSSRGPYTLCWPLCATGTHLVHSCAGIHIKQMFYILTISLYPKAPIEPRPLDNLVWQTDHFSGVSLCGQARSGYSSGSVTAGVSHTHTHTHTSVPMGSTCFIEYSRLFRGCGPECTDEGGTMGNSLLGY